MPAVHPTLGSAAGSTPPRPPTPPHAASVSLSALAAKHLDLNDDDWVGAGRSLYDELRSDALLSDAACWRAANDLVREVTRGRRAKMRGNRRIEEIRALGGWFNYALRGGLHLGEAKRPQLMEEILWHEKLERANGKRARWLRAIVDRMPTDDIAVQDVWREEEIGKLEEAA